jgi:hypothetical protein
MSTAQFVALILCGLLGLGFLAAVAFAPKYPSEPTRTVTTRSAWCQTHADDQWSGQMDDTTRRYFAECVR